MALDDKDWGDDSSIGWNSRAIAAAVVVALVVLAGLWVAFTGDEDDGNAAPSPTTERPASTTSTSRPEPTACPKAKESTAKALDGPVNMITYEGLELPQSGAGPKEINDELGLARCFDRSPTGAVLMATNFSMRALVSPEREEVVRRQISSGPTRDKAVREMARLGPRDGVEVCPVVGFRVSSFTSTDATVTLAFRCDDGQLRQGQADLVWENGDWLINGRHPTVDLPPLGSLAGFQSWEGA